MKVFYYLLLVVTIFSASKSFAEELIQPGFVCTPQQQSPSGNGISHIVADHIYVSSPQAPNDFFYSYAKLQLIFDGNNAPVDVKSLGTPSVVSWKYIDDKLFYTLSYTGGTANMNSGFSFFVTTVDGDEGTARLRVAKGGEIFELSCKSKQDGTVWPEESFHKE